MTLIRAFVRNLRAWLAMPREKGSERESVTPSDFMRVLDFGNSGYTQEDARNRLEQSTGVAWI